MCVLTEAAGSYLAQWLDESKAARGDAVRIVREADELKSRIDHARPGDQTFVHAGRRVLVLDAGVSKMLDRSYVDIEETERGPKLIVLQ